MITDISRLDTLVASLTKKFDSDECLREAFASAYFMSDVPVSWYNIRSSVFYARKVSDLLCFVRAVRDQIEKWRPPLVYVPITQERLSQVSVWTAWSDDLSIQSKISEYEKTLEDSFFIFCKKDMAHFLSRCRLNAGLTRKEQALRLVSSRFSDVVYSSVDNSYYDSAFEKLRCTDELAFSFSKHPVGRFFVLSAQEEKELLSSEKID